LPQTVSAKAGLSSAGARWRLLEIQELATLSCRASPCRETLLIGNLPRRLVPRFSARVAPHRGRHVTLISQKQPAHLAMVLSRLLAGVRIDDVTCLSSHTLSKTSPPDRFLTHFRI